MEIATEGDHFQRAIVVYESTVYPGATEEVCIPVLERESGMRWKEDFFIGYSPERINPGDREHTLTTILKVVSGDTPETLEKVAALYELIVKPSWRRFRIRSMWKGRSVLWLTRWSAAGASLM